MAYTTLRSLLSAIANAIRSVDGTSADINAQDFPERISELGDGNILFAVDGRAYKKSVVIPAQSDGHTVTSIGNYAYQNTLIRSITLPTSTNFTQIGSWAFASTALQKISVPDSVTTIGETAFYNCTSLLAAKISNAVNNLQRYLFYNCKYLRALSVSPNLSNIADYALSDCYWLTHIVSDYDVVNQGYDFTAEQSYNLAPKKIATVGNNAFSYCYHLRNIWLFSSSVTIGTNAFLDCYSLFVHGWTGGNVDTATANSEAGFIGYTQTGNEIEVNKIHYGKHYDFHIYHMAGFYLDKLYKTFFIPPEINNIPVTKIVSNSSFSGDFLSIDSVIFSENLVEIGGGVAIFGPHVNYVSLPLSLTTIGDYVFMSISPHANIQYSGTVNDWSSVTLGNDSFQSGAVIHCTDGDITI